jgi:hypothetical protein
MTRLPSDSHDVSSNDIRPVARDYVARGWAVVRIAPRSKKPLDDGWEKRVIEHHEVDRLFQPNMNVGVRLGPVSGNLVDVDLDCEEAVELADEFLPPTAAVFGRPSNVGSHRLYRSSVATRRFAWDKP